MKKRCRFVVNSLRRQVSFPVSVKGWGAAVKMAAGKHTIGVVCPYGHRGEEGTIGIKLAHAGKVVAPTLREGDRGFSDLLAGLSGKRKKP